MKRLFSLVLILLLTLPAFAGGAPMKPRARAWWVEADGVLVSAGNEHRKLAPASLTKMMTVLIALERTNLEDPIRVSQGAARETGHQLGLRAGEEFRVIDLAAAAVIASANDGARSLADHVGGSERGFVKLMNERAARMGMRETHFTNAAGHDDPDHYSSAHDLAILARAAMANPSYAELAGMVDLRIKSKGGRSYYLDNKNQLIGRYSGAIGVKTGTTPNAGKSLAAMAERDNRRALVIILAAKERWFQTERLLDLAFASAPAKVPAKKADPVAPATPAAAATEAPAPQPEPTPVAAVEPAAPPTPVPAPASALQSAPEAAKAPEAAPALQEAPAQAGAPRQ